jgi:N-methylhydantoinase A/oxoprolinase/acetone carboxylase beta subunit
VDGKEIYPWSREQLKRVAEVIRDKGIRSVVLVGVHAPSFPKQENEAAHFLSEQFGADFDVSCSHQLGNAGFLERENTAILNASIRRFAASMINGLAHAIDQILPGISLYMTLNDGTVSPALYAAQYPLKCFASGPTNSARGAAFIGMETLRRQEQGQEDEGDLLVIDVGGTTTDVCSLLPNGYPKHSPVFVKIGSVKTNLSMPQILNIALGGGSIIRHGHEAEVTVGPDSVGADELTLSLAAGGTVFTAADLAKLTSYSLINSGVPLEVAEQAKDIIKRKLELAVESAKTKPTDARVILVGGGSFILPKVESLKGVSTFVRPEYYEVANAIGAAIAKVSGRVDCVLTPQQQSMERLVEDGKREAIRLCCDSGGSLQTADIVDLEIIPETYSFNGSFRLIVRAVSDIEDAEADTGHEGEKSQHAFEPSLYPTITDEPTGEKIHDHLDRDMEQEDITNYSPNIVDDVWTLTETDIDLLVDGTGILGVGCMGEATNYLIGLKEAMRCGRKVQIVPLRRVKEDDVICSTCWIV